MATKPKEDNAQEASPEKGGSSKLLIIIIAVLLLVIAGGAAAFFLLGGSGGAKDAKPAAPVEHTEPISELPVFLSLDPFVVNLQPEDYDYYLQVALTLQVPNQQTADTLKLFMPQVRSRLLLLLSSKKASELLSNDGKENLRDEIIDELSEPFSGNRGLMITDVAYTSFVIQQQ